MSYILTIPGRTFTRSVSTDDFAEASRLYAAERDESGEGGSTFRDGVIRDHNDRQIARVSYNGRVWRLDADKPNGGGTLIYCPGSAAEDEGRPDVYNEGRESVWGRPRENPYGLGTIEREIFERGAAMARSHYPENFPANR